MENQKNININLACYEFTENLYNLVRTSKLPISMVCLIIKDLYAQLEETKMNTLANLIQQQTQEHTVEIPIIEEENKEE